MLLKDRLRLHKLNNSFVRDRWGSLINSPWNEMIKEDILKIENMEKMEYVDPMTFDVTEVEYKDTHYEVAEKIRNMFICDEYTLLTTNILATKEADKLLVGVKRGNDKYRIIIEPINEE